MLQAAIRTDDLMEDSDIAITANDLDRLAIRRLGDLLEVEGYLHHYLALTHGALYVSDHCAANAALGEMGSFDRALLSLFALGRAVERTELAGVAPTLDALERCGLLRFSPGGVRTSGWICVPVLRHLLITGTPSTYPGANSIGAAGYLGHDSLLLAASLPRTAGRRVLDLGAGSGVQGLLAAAGAEEAVLTDPDLFGLRLAALNVELVRPAHRVRILPGEGYEPVGDERFDLIVTLPPYVPTVPGSEASEIVAGGSDGLALIRRLFGAAPAHLSPGGHLIALAQLLCDDDGPLLERELASVAPGLVAQLSSFDWSPLQPYLLALTAKLTAHGAPASQAVLMGRYAESLRPLGVTGVCTTLITLTAPPTRVQHRSVGPLGRRDADCVPLHVGRVSAAVDPSDRHLVLDGVDLGVVAAPTLALAAAVDGVRSVRECAEVAWGAPEGAAAEDLIDQAIARFAELEGRGVLRLEVP